MTQYKTLQTDGNKRLLAIEPVEVPGRGIVYTQYIVGILIVNSFGYASHWQQVGRTYSSKFHATKLYNKTTI